MKQIFLPGGLQVTVTRKAVRHFRCRIVAPDGDVKASVPWHATSAQVEAFLLGNLAWIGQTRARIRAKTALHSRLEEGGCVCVGGKVYGVRLESGEGIVAAQRVVFDGQTVRLRCTPTHAPQEVWAAWCKRALQQEALTLVPRWEAKLGVRVRSLRARVMQTRWGSCTPSTGRIRLSTNLLPLPPEFLEYVLVHEMVHLLERRHNTHFYALMDTHLPQWRQRRAALHS